MRSDRRLQNVLDHVADHRQQPAAAGAGAVIAASERRLRLCIITTSFHFRSHGHHEGDRFNVGYPVKGRWHRPPIDVVSMYADQKPTEAGNVTDPNGSVGDLSSERAAQFGFTVYDTIAEALRCGGDSMAVDCVLLVGEHGEYGYNELGQHLLPRYEFFKQITAVFREDGKTAPVFNDKHLSWNWDWQVEMVAEARELGFAFGAGSSTPSNFRMPAVELPLGTEVDEIMAMGPGWLDGGDLHVLEIVQSVAERRKGGESGVRWVEALRGEDCWRAHMSGGWAQGGWSPTLFEACLCRSHTVAQVRRGFNHVLPTHEELRKILFDDGDKQAAEAALPQYWKGHEEKLKTRNPAGERDKPNPQHVREPVAYRWEYTDGTRGSLLLFSPLTGDWTVALNKRLPPTQAVAGEEEEGEEEDPLFSFLCHITPGPNNMYSAIHMAQAERVFLTNDTAFRPVERTLLTGGIVTAAMRSLGSAGEKVSLPGLESVTYPAPLESTFQNS